MNFIEELGYKIFELTLAIHFTLAFLTLHILKRLLREAFKKKV